MVYTERGETAVVSRGTRHVTTKETEKERRKKKKKKQTKTGEKKNERINKRTKAKVRMNETATAHVNKQYWICDCVRGGEGSLSPIEQQKLNHSPIMQS